MAKRFARFKARLERLIFAGLEPDAPVAPKKSKLEALVDSAEELAGRGLKPEDKALRGPMTWGHKIGIAAGIVLLCVFVYVLVTVLRRPAEQAETPGPPPPPLEIVPKGFQVEKNKDLEVVEIQFNRDKDPKEITGTLRNLTGRPVARCEVSFDVTTRSGEQLGGTGTLVTGIQPHGSVRFRVPVKYPGAAFVMVRELRPE
jgi:hypothetical protein